MIRTGERDWTGERPISLGAKLYATCAANRYDAGAPAQCEKGQPGTALRCQAVKTLALSNSRCPRCQVSGVDSGPGLRVEPCPLTKRVWWPAITVGFAE